MDPTNIPDSGESKIDESQSDDINDELNVEDLKNYCVDQSRSAKNIKNILDNYEKSPSEQQCLQEEHEQLTIPTDQCLSSDHDLAAGYETLLGITEHVDRLIEEIQEQAMKNKHLNDLQRKYEDLFTERISLIVRKDFKCNEEENFKTNTVLNTAYDEVGKFKTNPEKNVDRWGDGEDDKRLQSEKNGSEEQLGERNLLKAQPEEEVKQKLLELDENHYELELKYNEEKKNLEKEKEDLTIQKQISGIPFSEDDENLYSQKSELKPQFNEERNQEFEEINLFQVLCLMAQERDELKEQLSDLSEEHDLKAHDLEAKLSETAEEFRLVAQERDELKEKHSELSEKNDLMAHDLEAKLSETTEELHLVTQEREELKQKLSELSKENDLKVQDLETKLNETTEELRLVVRERDELKQKLCDLSEENENLHDHNNCLNCRQQNEETLLRNKINLINDNLQQVQSKLTQNVKELEQYRNLKESEVKSLNQNIANLSANMITLGIEKGSLQSQKSELKDQLRDIIVKFNFMSEECQKLEDYKCKQEKEQDVLKQQIQTLREEKEKLREYPHQLENLNHQHSTLKQKLKELEEKSLEETSMLKERFKSLQQEKYATEKKFFKRLQNEQDRHRKQLKVCNQKYCYQMMKAERSIAAAMQFIKMHSKAAEWSAPVTQIIKFLEAKAMQIVKRDDLINMQTDRDFGAHLQRLEKKCNELKTICHLHYKEREEKERKKNFIKIENSEYDSDDQNVSNADQIRSLKEQCKALDKELKFVKTKYQITRVAMKNAH